MERSIRLWGYEIVEITPLFPVLGLFSNLFRGTDIIPTDFIAGCILLRVKQKRECREQRRLALIAEQRYRCTSGNFNVFLTTVAACKRNYIPLR